ncbi:carboxy terminal-processing peptidase [Hymenobacter sp. M29]|uniref:Carboxy terminal-processing peptidase n=1 Tax=Hymenobacter mellowenesis TaxID=3063995 RepID=A0ABT9AI05_9BACT|nr:carboxy terminal-processing peptidase [Hymenobacter sp. M29]MDO7849508.1 carboxy terminal-processing peptidase [Hymenobacter sp. M29]
MSSSRLKVGLYAFLVTAVFVLASYRLFRRADSAVPSKDQVLIGLMMSGLTSQHYQPEKVDDAFSKRVFDLYLKRLDYRKQFLLATDVEDLRRYQSQIDDQVKRGSHEFLDLSTKLMAQRTKEMQGLYRELLAKPFDFTTDESFQSDFEKAAFPANKAAQRELWRKLLKYETLSRVSEMMEAQEKAKEAKPTGATAAPSAATPAAPTAAEPMRTPAQMEAEARKRVLKYYDEQFEELGETDANDRLSDYANAIANTYDPHTEYFAPKAKEDFDYEMTGRFEGIGASLREKDALIYVDEIIPGSPAARQGELKKGDALLRVAQGAAEPVSIEGWHTIKAIPLIKGKKGSEVRLTVKKPDGSTKIISIIRDVVVSEEKYAQSSVITDKGQKIGYLRLPSFYADFSDNGGRNSADDVRNELAKLNAEGVKGVILDLRFNGGGSLGDAVSMAGLFVDAGPIVQVRDGQAHAQVKVMNDNDPRVQYSGPLVVLVDKHSASASEILAAAMQDYHRGVIMGSTSTYGKGTVQRVFDLDEALPPELNSVKPIGSLKLTMQKFYRINGGSTQFKGVASDIVLPDLYSYLDDGEKESDYPLKWDEIQPARYKPWGDAPNIEKLRAASKARVANNASFRVMDEMAKSMRKRKDETTVSLKLSAYRAEQQQSKAISDRYEAAQKSTVALAFSPLAADLRALGGDTIRINRAARLTNGLKKDITIGEAVAVIQDEIQQK